MSITNILSLLGGLALFLYGMQMMSGGLEDAVFVLFGQNIGICITAVLAAIGTSKNAKSTTVIHLTFNIIGTTVFTIICLLFPLTALVEKFTSGNAPAQIANMHTLFNIVTTLLLLPVGQYLAKDNVGLCFQAIIDKDLEKVTKADEVEELRKLQKQSY